MNKKCSGCGRLLQTTDIKKWGYAASLDYDYCYRCFRIKNYHDLVVVDEEIDDNHFEKQITKLIAQQDESNHFFYLLDVFNLDATRIKSLEQNLNQQNTTIILNKIDLLPKAVKLSKIIAYLTDLLASTPLAKASIIGFSGAKKYGVDQLVNSIHSFKTSYFIGKTNVGKSSVMNTLLASVSEMPGIVESTFLNTTLDFIEFTYQDITLIDTPGIVQTNSFVPLIENDDLKLLYFKKEVKQLTFQINTPQAFAYGNLFGLVLNFSSPRDIHFYINPQLALHRTKPNNLTSYLIKHFSSLKPSLKNQPRYLKKTVDFAPELINQKIDLCIQELGWVSFTLKDSDEVYYFVPDNNADLAVTIRKALI